MDNWFGLVFKLETRYADLGNSFRNLIHSCGRPVALCGVCFPKCDLSLKDWPGMNTMAYIQLSAHFWPQLDPVRVEVCKKQ